MSQPVEQLELLLAVAPHRMVRREVLDQVLDAGPDLVGEVRRRRADEGVDVVDGRLHHRRELSAYARPPCGTGSLRTSLLLVTVLFWSFNFTVAKYALTHGFAPLAYSALRFGLGAVLFSAVTFGRERSLRIRRGDVALALGAAVLGIWLNQVSFTYAIRLTTAATVALMFGTLPIFVAFFSHLVGHERLLLRHYLAALVSFAGVALVAAGSGGQISGELGGILLGLAGAATWAAYSVAIAPLMRSYSPYRISAIVLLAGCLPLFASAARQIAEQDWGEPNALAWGGLLYGLVFSLVLTNVMWFTAIRPRRSDQSLALRESAAVPRRRLRAPHPRGGVRAPPGGGRPRDRRRHRASTAHAAPGREHRLGGMRTIDQSSSVSAP